jgi:hypothetical protein
MSETVTVTDVVEKERGWTEIQFAERGPASTKNPEIIARAREMKGQAAPAVINDVVNGNFTNTYLNEFAGISDKPKKSGGAPRARNTSGQTGETGDARQKNIESQWATGRAVELLIGSGVEYSFPLDSAMQKKLDEQAATLLVSKNRLAGS